MLKLTVEAVHDGLNQVCIDYKAKHFDMNKVRSGHYEELANLLSLEGLTPSSHHHNTHDAMVGMELELAKVQLSGVSGWSDVGTGVLCEWAPSIWESQIHR